MYLWSDNLVLVILIVEITPATATAAVPVTNKHVPFYFGNINLKIAYFASISDPPLLV